MSGRMVCKRVSPEIDGFVIWGVLFRWRSLGSCIGCFDKHGEA